MTLRPPSGPVGASSAGFSMSERSRTSALAASRRDERALTYFEANVNPPQNSPQHVPGMCAFDGTRERSARAYPHLLFGGATDQEGVWSSQTSGEIRRDRSNCLRPLE